MDGTFIVLLPSAPGFILQAENKIQSSSSLTLELKQVPKLLPHLTGSWCPRAFIVSFKVCQDGCDVTRSQSVVLFCITHTQLETDEKLVIPNAKKSIDKYGVQVWKLQLVLCTLCMENMSWVQRIVFLPVNSLLLYIQMAPFSVAGDVTADVRLLVN